MLAAVRAGLVLYVSEKIRTQNISYTRERLLLEAVPESFWFNPEPDMVKLLLESGANPKLSYRGSTAMQRLFETCTWRAKDLRVMQLLLDYGADPNAPVARAPNHRPDYSPLGLVIRQFPDVADNGDTTILRTFMERGADIRAKDGSGESVLELAEKLSSALAAFLLEHQPKQRASRTKILGRHMKRNVQVLRYRWYNSLFRTARNEEMEP